MSSDYGLDEPHPRHALGRMRYIFLPVSLYAVAIIVAYAPVYWLIDLLLGASISEREIVRYGLPIATAIVFSWLVANYYERVFHFEGYRESQGYSVLLILTVSSGMVAVSLLVEGKDPLTALPLGVLAVVFLLTHAITIFVPALRLSTYYALLRLRARKHVPGVARVRRRRLRLPLYLPSVSELVRARATWVFAGLILLVWILMVASGVDPVSPTEDDLYAWGGIYPPSISEGEWWRLLTAMFVQPGILYLLLNLIVLLIAGPILEVAVGWGRFALVYLVSGLAASLATYLTIGDWVWAGASGAVIGIAGTLLVFSENEGVSRAAAVSEFGTFVVVLGIAPEFFGIESFAHLAGLLPGFIFGGYMLEARQRAEGKDPTLP